MNRVRAVKIRVGRDAGTGFGLSWISVPKLGLATGRPMTRFALQVWHWKWGTAMNDSNAFILMAVVVLAILALMVFLAGGKRAARSITPLGGLAFAFVLAGLVFGDERMIGYGLMGVGVVLAMVDMVKKLKGTR